MPSIRWSELGNPTTPGAYRVRRFGTVEVTEDKIRLVQQHGGDVLFDLIDVSTLDAPNSYELGLADPEDQDRFRTVIRLG